MSDHGLEFHLYLPQMRLSFDALVERAQAAEAAGFDGIAFMDHLAPPLAEAQPMHDAMITAAWVGAHTSALTVGHLVLADAFREPAVLAKQAASLSHATAGRFELGIGWGSAPAEMDRFGIDSTTAADRVARLGDTLDVVKALWTGELTDHEGSHHRLRQAQQQPVPAGSIPIVIGGAGPKTMRLVAAHATWWNCPIYGLDQLDRLRPQAGEARLSTQQMVGFVPNPAARDEVASLAARRFGHWAGASAPVVGTPDELIDHFCEQRSLGVERVYVWFTDFAVASTLDGFADVIAGVAAQR